MGKGGGETNTVSKFEPPDWAAGLWPEYVNRALNVSDYWANSHDMIYGSQPGQDTFADLNAWNKDAAQGYMNLAQNITTPDGRNRIDQRQDAAHQNLLYAIGGNLTQGPSQRNDFAGVNSPYLNQMIQANIDNAARGYATGTQAQRMAASSRARATGGTADQEYAGVQDKAFADSIGEMANRARQEAFQQSAGLEEARINRDWQAQEAGYGRRMQGLGLAQQQDTQEADFLQKMYGIGELQRDADREWIDIQRDQWNQIQQLPLIALDILGGALTRSSGGAGQSTTSMFGGYSPWQTAAGLGGMAGGLFNAFR